MTVFSKNLKIFRCAKNITQEQAAEALGVSTQTVSRWECNTTLPDVTILPKIAALYCVTIDDLYKETSVVYDNYARRLCSVFEASHKPEDFMHAEMEYQKLLKSGDYTTADLYSYGLLNQYMMQACRDKAEELFNRVIKKGSAENPETYWSTRRQKGYFLWEIGRNQENINTFLPLIEGGSNDLQEWICLIQAYTLAENFTAALKWVHRAESRFPESAMLHIYAGDLLRSMKRYDDAFPHWKRALEIEPEQCDAAFSMGFCYEELGEYEKAYEVWTQLAEALKQRGFESEVSLPRSQAHKCWQKMSIRP